MKNKIALISGVTGQDGSYLAKFLLNKGYIVHGIKRISSSYNTHRIDSIYQDYHQKNIKFYLHYGDITDSLNITEIIQRVNPDEIYNLAAQSHVKISFNTPEYTANCNAIGTLRILEAIRFLKKTNVKIYQASSSELFGNAIESPQSESTPFNPRSPYAIAKLYAYWIIKNYREAYNIFACNGILFNHESPVRGETFVTRKITMAVANFKLGNRSCLFLGNLNAKRDWGHASDYVKAMWLMLQQDKPEDFVISTGKQISVRRFVELSFQEIGININWKGSGLNEVGVDNNDNTLVKIDKNYFRPTEIDNLIGDSSKAKNVLGWQSKIDINQLISEMVQSDIKLLSKK